MKKLCISIKWLMIVLVFLLQLSCSTLKPIAPPESYETPVIESKPSVISLPLELDMKDLENRINKELKGTLYEDNSFDNNNGDNLKVKAIKKENFSVGLNGTELTYRIPLRLEIQIKKFVVLPFTAEIALKYKTTFTLNKDWTINTKTVSNGYDWLSTPTITVAGYDISIRYIADIVLNAGKEKITKEIDKAVKDNVNLRDYVLEAWNDLQKPIKVSEEYNAWIRINPMELIATQITGKNNKVNLGVGIKSVNEVFVGTEPAVSDPKKLPNLNLVAAIEPKFSVNLNTDLDIGKVNELVQKELVGQVFKSGKKTVQIKAINLYGSNNAFIVEVDLTGSVKGKVFLRGRPEYNPATKSIEIKDMDFDVNTKNALIKSANWLLHDRFIKMIEPKLTYDISKDLEDVKKLIQDNLKENRSIKGLLLKGNLTNLEIDKIYITPKSIKVVIFLEGVLIMIVENLTDM